MKPKIMNTKTVVLFKAAEGMPIDQVARTLAGHASHPIVVAVNQILADELAEAITVAADPKIQKEPLEVAHALGQVDMASRVRVRLAELASQEREGV